MVYAKSTKYHFFGKTMKTFKSITLLWIEGILIDIEIDIHPWIPSFSIVWLGDTAIQESRERIRASIKNSWFKFPASRVTVNLAPAHIRKTGSWFDLAIAIGIICPENITNTIPAHTVFLGELSLDGSLRPLESAFSLVYSAWKSWVAECIIPYENYQEVCGISGIRVIPIHNLKELLEYLQTGMRPQPPLNWATEIHHSTEGLTPYPVLESIIWQAHAKRALMIAAAGRHNLLFEWPPWSWKSMLANSIQGILPDLTQEESLEVLQIHSTVWIRYSWIPKTRPFRHVHHSASSASIVGWGKYCRPGEMSLAHRWVLFFDEFPEFDRRAIESLREPIESRNVTIWRISGSISYPASFMFVGAMNPCPCGYMWDPNHHCSDTSAEVSRYRNRISGPILDRIDIFARVERVMVDEFNTRVDQAQIIHSEHAKQIVTKAFERAMNRQWVPNAELSIDMLSNTPIQPDALKLLQSAIERLSLSIRSYHRLLRVARTIADLSEKEKIAPEHVAEAIWFRQI